MTLWGKEGGGGGGELRGHDVFNFALSVECKLTLGTVVSRSFERPRALGRVQFQCVFSFSVC